MQSHDWAPTSAVNNNHNIAVKDAKDSEKESDVPTDKLRTIPPWVIIPDTEDGRHSAHLHLKAPGTPVIPHHQYLPESQRGNRAAKGRRWDHLRNAEPALLDQSMANNLERWKPFMASGPQYRQDELLGAQYRSEEWMDENMPFWSARPDDDEPQEQEKRKSFLFDAARRRGSVTKAGTTILRNPFVPLVFRLITTLFSLAALGLGARVFHQTNSANRAAGQQCVQRASTYISVIVNTIAIPYIIYVTWDEYTSKPLGLRSATAKTSLLLVDLYFIIFYSSSLSLAFDALTDNRWACYSSELTQTCPESTEICQSQRGLTAVLLVALVAWLVTFSISVLRVVKRLRPDE